MTAEKSIKTVRASHIDNAKVLCLYLILFCHIPPVAGDFHIFCYSFHVQIFFLFAGAFYKERPLRNIISSSFKSLVIPYFIWNLAIIVFKCVLGLFYGFSLTDTLLQPLLGTLLGSSAKDAPFSLPGGPSWFLIALFIARILLTLVLRATQPLKSLIIASLGGIFYLSYSHNIWLPFSIPSAILGLPFMIAGFYAKKYIIGLPSLKFSKKFIALVILIALAPLSLNNGLSNMFDGSFGNNILLFYFFGGMLSLLITILFSFVQFHSKFVSLMIEGSVFFICCHSIIMEYVSLIGKRTLGLNEVLLPTDKIVVLIITGIICTSLIFVIKKLFPKALKYM